MKAHPLPRILQSMFNWANTCLDISCYLPPGRAFNGVLVNFYNNGHHYIGTHSDDEKELYLNSVIFSASLGQHCIFRIRDKNNNKQIIKNIELEDGAYILMCENATRVYT